MARPVWSAPARVVLGVSGALLLAGTVVFVAALFLVNAPPDAVPQRYQGAVDALVYPEFEQNWQLFAPDPAQQNVSVSVRVATSGGTGDWVDLTAQDLRAIRGNPVPSHVDQNQLRRAWDFYDLTHQGAPDWRAGLAEQYLKRIALRRLGRTAGGESIQQIQFRVAATPIDPPSTVTYRELPWWPVAAADYAGLT